jgi:inhibitor of cysteine peptidase
MLAVRRRFFSYVFFYLLLLVLASCAPQNEEIPDTSNSTPTVTSPSNSLAPVTAVNIQIMESFPVQVAVVATGILPDSCTAIGEIEQLYDDVTFQVNIGVIRSEGVACEEREATFEERIDLEVIGLPAGIYVVDVNGLQGTFTLQTDNVLDEGTAVLGGRVWHDLCAVSLDPADEVVSSDGCVPNSDEEFEANGLLDPQEPGVGGIVIELGAGECPSTGLATTITDGEGVYLFSGLNRGNYCISIDPAEEPNNDILIPGQWTYPETNVDEGVSVDLATGENNLDFNFGWDYEFLPVSIPEEEACTNLATFIADVTVPDDTVYAPDEAFTKIWQFRNDGSCPWESNYGLAFIAGEQMGAPDFVSLDTVVEPGEEGEISINLIAPSTEGTYRGEWKLHNAEGALFGIGQDANAAFWVQIVVEE